MFKSITNPNKLSLLFSFTIMITYSMIPATLYVIQNNNQEFYLLTLFTFISSICIIIASGLPNFDFLYSNKIPKIRIDLKKFLFFIWFVFLLFILVSWLTADGIPLIHALSGADSEAIRTMREEFYKARGGSGASLVYINAILSGALIPWCLALMFLHKIKFRYFALLIFILHAISFMEKAFFLKAFLPLFYLASQKKIRLFFKPSTLFVIIISLILAMAFISGIGSTISEPSGIFFSSSYQPGGTLGYMIWRTIAIPVVTASDSIKLFYDNFSGTHLLGATSGFIANIFNFERIFFERLVFAYQWGQNSTGTGSANSVFIIEAFVNYGLFGVIIFSWIIGIIFRMFAKSRDEAFRSLSLIFFLGVFSSGLIGTLLSNGFLLLFFISIFIKFNLGSEN